MARGDDLVIVEVGQTGWVESAETAVHRGIAVWLDPFFGLGCASHRWCRHTAPRCS